MTIDIPAMLPAFVQIALLTALLVLSMRMIRESGRSLTVEFLLFVYALWLFTDLYWVIYYIVRPGIRKPFAVNEIGEAAAFLLMAAMLSTAVGSRLYDEKKPAVGAALFSACNVVLWIAWSGEWVQDILIGAAFAYFLCTGACALKRQRQLSGSEWIGLGIGCALLILAQGMSFIPEARISAAAETGSYILLAAGAVYWVCKLVAAHRHQTSAEAMLCLVFAFLSWSMMAKYMSDGIWYTAFMAAEMVAQLFMYLSVRKVAEKA